MKKIIITFFVLFINLSNQVFASEQIDRQDLRDLFVVSGTFVHHTTKYGYYLFDKRDNEACKKPKGTFALMDHEGGVVRRFNSNLPSAKTFLNQEKEHLDFWDDDINYIKSKCIDLVLGPTTDINLFSRSYSNEYPTNFQAVSMISNIFQKHNMKFTIKHFPGVGFYCYSYQNKWEIQICNDPLPLFEEQFENLEKHKEIKSIMISNNTYLLFSEKIASSNTEIYKKIDKIGDYFKIVDSQDELPKTPSDEDWLIMVLNADAIIYQIPNKVEKVIDNILPTINSNSEYINIIQQKKKRKINFFQK